MKELDVELETPWGSAELTAGDGMVQLIKMTLNQLETFKKEGNNSTEINNDIQGYRMLLSSGNPQHNCREFIRIKADARASGRERVDNLDVIKVMVARGIWKHE